MEQLIMEYESYFIGKYNFAVLMAIVGLIIVIGISLRWIIKKLFDLWIKINNRRCKIDELEEKEKED